MLDVFKATGFDTMTLTRAINRAPFTPSQLGQMRLFRPRGITKTTVGIDVVDHVLQVYTSRERGTPGQATEKATKSLKDFRISHIPVDFAVMADDVQGQRMTGSETAVQTTQNLLTEKLERVKQNMEATWEHLRIGCVKGQIYDGDGTTLLLDLFAEFGFTQLEVDFLLGTSTTDIRSLIRQVKRHIAKRLGTAFHSGVHAMCGFQYFEKLINHAETKTAFARYQDGAALRDDMSRGFPFAGCMFKEWVGSVGNLPFVKDDEAHFFPVGVPGLFEMYFGPAPYEETVNTVGVPLYVKTERMEFDVGRKIQVQSNPLAMCAMPDVLVKGVTSN